MMVQTSCPACGKTGKVPAPYLGRTVGCKRCNTLFKVGRATAPRAHVGALGADNAWDDMPPIMVDIPLPFADEAVPA
jgi:hypothetical protein